MFTLARDLKNSIEFEGVEYQVDMAFDNILRFNELMNDTSLQGGEQIAIGLQMLFDKIPNLSDKSLVDLFYFAYEELLGQQETEVQYDIKGNPMPVNRERDEDGELKDSSAHFDLEQDAEYIFSSFFQAYKIDLHDYRGVMHWYKFKALLSGLPDDSKLKQIISIRRDPLPSGKGTAKEREHMKKLKKEYALKPKRS